MEKESIAGRFERNVLTVYLKEKGEQNIDGMLNRMMISNLAKMLTLTAIAEKEGPIKLLPENATKDTFYSSVVKIDRAGICLFGFCTNSANKVIREDSGDWHMLLCDTHYEYVKSLVNALGSRLWEKEGINTNKCLTLS